LTVLKIKSSAKNIFLFYFPQNVTFKKTLRQNVNLTSKHNLFSKQIRHEVVIRTTKELFSPLGDYICRLFSFGFLGLYRVLLSFFETAPCFFLPNTERLLILNEQPFGVKRLPKHNLCFNK
jgi:hypothetical protein